VYLQAANRALLCINSARFVFDSWSLARCEDTEPVELLSPNVLESKDIVQLAVCVRVCVCLCVFVSEREKDRNRGVGYGGGKQLRNCLSLSVLLPSPPVSGFPLGF